MPRSETQCILSLDMAISASPYFSPLLKLR